MTCDVCGSHDWNKRGWISICFLVSSLGTATPDRRRKTSAASGVCAKCIKKIQTGRLPAKLRDRLNVAINRVVEQVQSFKDGKTGKQKTGASEASAQGF